MSSHTVSIHIISTLRVEAAYSKKAYKNNYVTSVLFLVTNVVSHKYSRISVVCEIYDKTPSNITKLLCTEKCIVNVNIAPKGFS